MEKINKILSRIKQENFLVKAVEFGINPQGIKNAVIETLSPYFEHKDILVEYAINLLIPEFINVMKLKEDASIFDMFEKCYQIYRNAKYKDKHRSFEIVVFWHNYIEQCISKFWTIFSLEQDKDILQNEEMVFECFRNIGDIIEGLSKPFLKSLLSQKRLTDETEIDLDQINHYDLGKIVTELIERTNYYELLMPPPWFIKLNHWRNIAYHHNYIIKDDNIICLYGKGNKMKQFNISKNELFVVAKKIFNCFIALKLAYNIFAIDNLRCIETYFIEKNFNIRFEALFIIIAAGIASQGFEILTFENNLINAKIVVKDLTNQDPFERSIHASQFLYSLWLLTKSKNMNVEYWDNNRNPKYSFGISSKICELIYDNKQDFCEIANKMKIKILR